MVNEIVGKNRPESVWICTSEDHACTSESAVVNGLASTVPPQQKYIRDGTDGAFGVSCRQSGKSAFIGCTALPVTQKNASFPCNPPLPPPVSLMSSFECWEASTFKNFRRGHFCTKVLFTRSSSRSSGAQLWALPRNRRPGKLLARVVSGVVKKINPSSKTAMNDCHTEWHRENRQYAHV